MGERTRKARSDGRERDVTAGVSRWRWLGATALLVAVVSVGCGDDDGHAATVIAAAGGSSVPVVYRSEPNITPTTLPSLDVFIEQLDVFIEQDDGSLIAEADEETLEGPLFEYRSASLTNDAKEWLDRLLPRILAHGGNVVVHGWTDGAGPENENLALSERRAQSAADYLISRGVTGHITIVAHGEEGAENDLPDRSRRRVEIELVGS